MAKRLEKVTLMEKSTVRAKLVKPVCNECGGEVVVDAWAEWDYEGQRWELGETFDNGFCTTCGYEIRYSYSWKEARLVKGDSDA
jgi:hypothetical protein